MAARIGNALFGLDAIRMTRELGSVAPVRPVRRVTSESSGTEPSRSAAAVFEFSTEATALAQTFAKSSQAVQVLPTPQPLSDAEPPERDPSGAPVAEFEGALEVLGDSSSAAEPSEPAAVDGASTPDESPSARPPDSAPSAPNEPAPRNSSRNESEDPNELTPEQESMVKELKQRDAEVRAHENAHRSAGGPYAGSPSFTLQLGPDGRRYAIGGEVPLDVAPIKDDPRATMDKMQTIIRAALAPAQPSSTDYRIAANARAHLQAARVEETRQRQEVNEADAASRSAEAQDLPDSPSDEPTPSVSDLALREALSSAMTQSANAGTSQSATRHQ